ncbi:MAG: hypothetical protein EOP06_20865, partial [Proteobacteria bacterium]
MSTPFNKNTHLDDALRSHRMRHLEILMTKALAKREAIKDALQENYGDKLATRAINSGSYAKHTAVNIKFDVDIVEKTRFSYDASGNLPNIRPKSCASLKFTCSEPGSTRVWISYSDPTDLTSKAIKATTMIACFKPLKPVYPIDVGVIALHTSIEMAFENRFE